MIAKNPVAIVSEVSESLYIKLKSSLFVEKKRKILRG
jgi:hypothetical protein